MRVCGCGSGSRLKLLQFGSGSGGFCGLWFVLPARRAARSTHSMQRTHSQPSHWLRSLASRVANKPLTINIKNAISIAICQIISFCSQKNPTKNKAASSRQQVQVQLLNELLAQERKAASSSSSHSSTSTSSKNIYTVGLQLKSRQSTIRASECTVNTPDNRSAHLASCAPYVDDICQLSWLSAVVPAHPRGRAAKPRGAGAHRKPRRPRITQRVQRGRGEVRTARRTCTRARASWATGHL